MPIPGETWGEINKTEKPKVGGREFDLRETKVVNGMADAANKIFEPSVQSSEEMYAVILREEPPTTSPADSNAPALSRFRCYVFSGPHSEIPFDMGSLGTPTSTSPTTTPQDEHTTEMFPIFTCKNGDLTNQLSSAKPGTVVKIVYGNRQNLSQPTIVDTTSYDPLVPQKSRETKTQFKQPKSGTTARNSDFQRNIGSSATVNKGDIYRARSLRAFNNKSLELNWPLPGRQINIDFGRTVTPATNKKEIVVKNYRNHQGLDVAGNKGEPIYSVEKGKVIRVEHTKGVRKGFGLFVEVEHKKNGIVFTSIYAHLSQVFVRIGQKVIRGQKLGGVGKTGNATGFHLHFQLNKGGRAVDSIPHFINAPNPVFSPNEDTIKRVIAK